MPSRPAGLDAVAVAVAIAVPPGVRRLGAAAMPMVARPRTVQVAAILRTAEEVIFVSTRWVVRCPDPRRLQLDIDTGDTVRRFCPKLRELCGECCSGEAGENGGGFSWARGHCARAIVPRPRDPAPARRNRPGFRQPFETRWRSGERRLACRAGWHRCCAARPRGTHGHDARRHDRRTPARQRRTAARARRGDWLYATANTASGSPISLPPSTC